MPPPRFHWGFAIAGAALAWLAFSWATFYLPASAHVERYDSTLLEAYRVKEPGFADGFRDALPTGPLNLFRFGGNGSWYVVGAVVVVLMYWRRSASSIRAGGLAAGHLVASAAPLLIGIAYFPWALAASTAALRELGLSHPEAIGAGFAEALYPAILGLLGSAALLAGLLLWRLTWIRVWPGVDSTPEPPAQEG